MASRLDHHISEIVAGRREGESFSVIAARLSERHGLTITNRGLSAWYRRRQRRLRERAAEVEVFGIGSGSGAPVTAPVVKDRERDEDLTVPASPRGPLLTVKRNS